MKKIPMRSCVITKEKLPKKELIRVVRTPDGEVIIDVSGKANGRGAYLKKDIEVIKKAKSNKLLNRVLEVEVPDKIYEEYSNGTRSVKDVIDDTVAQYKWMYDRIKSEKDNMGYGRLKVNLLAPNASLDSIISNNLYENSLTPLQKLKIKKGKSTYRDLMTMYDKEFKNNFK